MSATIIPVLLAGGSGTRLWPLSRKTYPKQFSELIGTTSLFQKSASRLRTSKIAGFADPMVVTNSDYRFIITEQLQTIGVDPGPILIEPAAKNTAPAILAAIIYAEKKSANSVFLVAPADHVIPDTQAFHAAVAMGLREVEAGNIVTFGVTPTRAETGYGYLELISKADIQPVKLKRFIEKPNLNLALDMLDNENYLWNAGIFLFRGRDMIDAFTRYAPALVKTIESAVDNGKPDLGFFRLDSESWMECQDISIDYAVMEQAKNLVAIPFSAGWSDLGSWDAVWQELGPNQNGVVQSENAYSIDCKDVLLRSENESQKLVGFGLENIVAVAMPDAVLVANKDRVGELKQVVQTLKKLDVVQAEVFPKDHRPWGWFNTLAIRDRFQVKQIFVKPGGALSLQSHRYRSEHWVVVEGIAKVTVNEEIRVITEGQSVYVPLGAVHRMENTGEVPMVLIEVQTGSYLGEDDIIRYEDVYKRS